MRRTLVLSALSLSFCLHAPARARAQTGDSLPHHLDTLQVRVLRSPLPALRAPFAVSVAGGERERAARPGMALNEALAALPGVQVENRYNYALGERISIRGMGARAQFGVRGVRVLLDGLPATLPDGQTQLNHVDVTSLGSAEVVRGPAAALYGNASAGVVRLSTLPPAPVPLASEYHAIAGDDGLLRLQAVASGSVARGDYRASLTRLRFHGYREHQRADNSLAGFSAGVRRGADALRLVFTAVRYEGQNPGALSDSMLRADPGQAVPTNVTQRAGERGRQGQVGLSWQHALGRGALEVTLHGLERSIANPIPVRYIDLDRRSGGARLAWSAAAGPLRWSTGAEWELQRDHRVNHQNLQGARGTLVLDQRERVDALGAFAELGAALGPAQLVGALRHDHFRFGVRDALVTAKDPDDSGARTLHAWSPMLGASLALRSWLSLYGNVASSFQTPTTSELANQASGAGGFNPDLGPERAHSLEAGAKARWSTAWLELAAYHSRVDSMLVGFEVPGFPGRQFYRNAGQALHRGIEVGAGAQPTSALSLRAALTLIDARFTRYQLGGVDLDGNRVPGISPRRFDSTVFWQSRGGPFAALDLLTQSRTPVADGDSLEALASAGFYLLSLRSGWRELRVRGARLTPTLGIGNLLDRRYNTSVVVNAARGRFYEPGPGRTLYAGVEARLGSGR